MQQRSAVVKNKDATCTATGIYPFRASSIRASVLTATFCFSAISTERTFDEEMISIAVSSSNIFPSELDKIYHKQIKFHSKSPRKLSQSS